MEKKKIIFSHNYPKLYGQNKAELLAIKLNKSKSLSQKLIDYDTTWNDNGVIGKYPLPKTDLIQLIFLGNDLIPFCTFRKYTKDKFDYYKKNIGEIFQIEITRLWNT